MKARTTYFGKKKRFDRIFGTFFIGFTFLLVCVAAFTMVAKRLTEGEQTVTTPHLFEMPLTVGAAFWVIFALGMFAMIVRGWLDERRKRNK